MPRRSRRRIVGRWEQIEQDAREEELKELERELHGEQRGQKLKTKRKRCRQRTEPPAPDAGSSCNSGTDDTGSNG